MTTTLHTCSIESVFNAVPKTGRGFEFKIGDVMATGTIARLRLFKSNPTCVCCGRKADIAVATPIDKSDKFRVDVCISSPQGPIPLTSDHMLPECMGGVSTHPNMQTMCLICNAKKSSSMFPHEIAAVRLAPTLYSKEWVDRDYLMYLLDLAEALNDVIESGSDVEILRAKKDLESARIKLRYGKKLPPIPKRVNPLVAIPTWKDWWNSRPSLLAPVYGWLGQHHDMFLAI